jgi:hypothetical protein
MTSTSFNIGMSNERASSKVLKPPGGGTSDIFGGSEPAEKPIGRKKSVQASSIVLNDNVHQNGGGPVENGHSKQGTCNERLFGPPLDANASNAVAAKTNGEVITNGNDHPDAPAAPKQATTNGRMTNGEAKHAAAGVPTAPRNRVPPGGYSSGLW